ncbi:AraC family transcriptional regulator, partial [Streptomyces sp. SID10116]|nr:AraC family transcriptional regulator [Streptomyces sp. SID10116]
MTHRVAFLVFDGVTLLDVSGPVEVLHQAGRLGFPYETVLVSPRGGDVTTSSGLALAGSIAAADAGSADIGPLNTVVIAGADRLALQPLDDDVLTAADVLARQAARVASVCSGAFVLAA